MSGLSHVDKGGRVRMVDVTDKATTARTGVAVGELRCQSDTLRQVREGTAPKGAVVQTAELAGIMAAKRTADLIPLCHPLPLTSIVVRIELDEALPGFRVEAEARTNGETGVEMEALIAASVACLTLFDMLKAIDRSMVIGGIAVVAKSGGKSGNWQRSDAG